MADYPYIIASFPDLLPDFSRQALDEAAVVAGIKERLSENECKTVDLLEFGLDGKNLTNHFYRTVRQSDSRFIREWFDFDKKLRLAKVAHLENRPVEEEFDEQDKAAIIFRIADLIQREKLLDKLCWTKAEELTQFNIFDLDLLLSMLVRLHIAARWSSLDPETGKKLFRKLVDEVRGSFQGINAEQI
ncbi:MAG: DUF2764 domain-containing protein [Bacteroidales bacterium]|nr:DUF2764 domain-containing protein [Bacteroidales bacterium]